MTNRAVAGIETIFIMTSEQYGFTSSTLIREVASLGGDLSNLIPKSVHERLKQHLKRTKHKGQISGPQTSADDQDVILNT
jgi:pantetheine-phosphate adenylyltransferase